MIYAHHIISYNNSMENNNKADVLLQLWADDTILKIRRRVLLNNNNAGQQQEDTIEMMDRDLERLRDNTAACLQKDVMTVTEIITMLCAIMRPNRIAAQWLLHQFASARINPILFSTSQPTNNLHIVEDWIADLHELLNCFHTMHECPPIIEDQFPIAMVQARLYELEHSILPMARDKWVAMMMATDRRWGKDSPLHTLDPDLLKRYLL